jgi:vacuolar-type H+-ATPase subunit D/Vma8
MRTLEQRVAPRLLGQIGDVRRALDEREREERIRLKHVGKALHARR